MFRLVAQRLLYSVPLILGVGILLFFLLQAMPGDASDFYLHPDQTAEQAEQIRRNLGLDEPVLMQFGKWLASLVSFDFQQSFAQHRPVSHLILEALPRTVALVGAGMILMLVLGVGLGILGAVRRRGILDHVLTVGVLLFFSIPPFLLGIFLILCFSLGLGWLPVSGVSSPGSEQWGFFFRLADGLAHLALPAATLGLTGAAVFFRYTKNALVENIESDFVQAGRARGISERNLLFRYAFRGSLLPLITLFGLMVPSLVGGVVVIEKVFSWNGLGLLLVDSILSRDYPVVLGITFLTAVFVVLGNLGADLLYRWADPRLRKVPV